MSPWHVMAIILPHLKLIKDNSLKSQLTQKLIAILITTDMTSARGWNGAAAITVPARDVYTLRGFYLTNLSSLYGCSITSRVTTEMRSIK